MQRTDAAAYLAGIKQTERAQASEPTNLHVISGTVGEASEDGKVQIAIDGLMFSESDSQYIDVDTIGGLQEGDIATILLTGESGHAMTPLAIGGVGSVDRIVVRVDDIEADYVKASLLEAKVATFGYAHITEGVIDNATIDHADVNNLSANYAHISDGVIDNAEINGANIVDGTITGTQIANATIKAANIANSTITATQIANSTITSAKIKNGTIEAADIKDGTITGTKIASATIENSNIVDGTITGTKIQGSTLTDIPYAEIDELKAANVTSSQIAAATGYIGDLTTGNITAANIIADHGTVGNLAADHVTVQEFRAEQGFIDTLQANTADIANIRANAAKVANLTAAQLEADHATISQLDTNYARADMANVSNAWIENGTVKNGAISDAMIGTLSASKLTAGTINGAEINVTNLNANNITAGTINGQRIGEGSLSLSKLEEDVYTQTEVDNIVDGLQAEIDGAIETWTGNAVPTLQNAPAVNWTTNSDKDKHVGDVYFVVNSALTQNGYNYRFTKSGSTYSWQLIKDSDVTNALQRLTTAEGKITTFDSDISQLKTDTGSLTTRTTTLETSIGDKVDVTEFNELSDTVEGHSQSITKLTNSSTTLANPNLSPFFSWPLDDRYVAATNPDGYWNSIASYENDWIEYLSDGWVHAERENTTDEIVYITMYASSVWQQKNTPLKTDTVYTVLGEIRNRISENTDSYLTLVSSSTSNAIGMFASAIGGNSSSGKLVNIEKELRGTTTTRSSFSNSTTVTRTLISIAPGESVSLDLRLSIYEGVYDGPYKPYVGPSQAVDIRKTAVQVSSIEHTVDGIGTRVGSLETTITTKADNSTVETVSNNLSTLQQDVNGFKTTVSSTYATKESVDNIQIGGRNLFKNSSALTDAWSKESATVADGVITITKKASGNSRIYQMPANGYWSWEAGQTYTVSVDAKGGSDGCVLNFNPVNTGASSTKTASLSTEWARYSYTFTVTQDSTGSMSFFNSGSTGDVIQLRYPKLEHGSKPTDWTPAPEDMATSSALTSVTERVTQAESTIEQHDTSIALKANSSDVYTKTESNGLISTEVTNRNAAISAATDAITLSVSETYAMKKELGARNLIDILSATRGYLTINGNVATASETNNELISDFIEVTPDDAMLFQYWVSVTGTGNGAGAGWMAYGFYDSAKAFLVTPGRASKFSNFTSAPAPWHGLYEITVPAGAAYMRVSWRENTDGIARLERTSDADANISQQITAAKAAIKLTTDGISTEVSKKVGNTEIISKINQSSESIQIQADKVNIAGATIFTSGRLSEDSLNNAYDSNGAAAAVQTNLNNLEIGGRNLLRDTKYMTSWGKTNGTTIADGVVTFPTVTADTWREIYPGRNFKYDLIRNKQTTFSCEANVPSGQTSVLNLCIGLDTTETANARKKFRNQSVTITGTGTWQKVSVTADITDAWFSAGSGTVDYDNCWVTVRPGAWSNSRASFQVRLFKLELGAKATDWSPAPEDVANDISASVMGQGGFTILWNYSNFTMANNGEAYVCALDPLTNQTSDEAGWAMWNGVQRTISNVMINPNSVIPFRIPIYVVCRLSSADSTTGTLYLVWYNDGWKYAGRAPSSVDGDFTWVEATDMVLGTFVMTSAEGAISETVVFRTPWSSKQVTTSTVTANSAQNLANTANSTANAAAPKANAVKRTQRIYYRSNSSTPPDTPGTASSNWVTKADDGNAAWTKMHVAISSTHKYIYTCEQYEMANGTVGYTSVLLDNTITVIDGGKVITGSIKSNSLDADSVKTNIVQTTDLSADKITSGTISTSLLDAATIKTNIVQTTNLSADKITSGYIDAARIQAGSLSTSVIDADSAAFDSALIPNLDASKITSGYISADRIQAGSLTIGKVDGLETTLGAKANSSDVYTKTETNNAINAIEIGSRNLVLDTSFDTPDIYTKTADGSHVVRRYELSEYASSSIKNGSKITVTFEGKVSAGSFPMQVYIGYYDGTTATTIINGGSPTPTFTTEWTKLSRTLDYNSDLVPTWIQVTATTSTSSSGKTYSIRGMKLELGNKATDWTPAPEDTDSALSTKLDASGNRIWYAECSTVAATTAKVATITPTTTSFTLVKGQTVNVWFSATNTGAVGDITLNVNNTGAKSIKYLNNGALANLPNANYLKANQIVTFTYDGTYWVTDFSYYDSGGITNARYRTQYANAIKAATAIDAAHIICGTSAGYKNIAANVEFNLDYPLLYATAAITAASTGTSNYLTYNGVNVANNGTVQGVATNKMVYLKGTVTGNTFKIAASNFLTCTVPSSADGVYIPLGIAYNTTPNIYFSSNKDLYAYVDGAFGPISIREASAAAKTATNYISLHPTDGIKIANANPATATTYQHLTATSTEFVVEGDSMLELDGTNGARIGKASSNHINLDSDSIDFVSSNDSLPSFTMLSSRTEDSDAIIDEISLMDGASAGWYTPEYVEPSTMMGLSITRNIDKYYGSSNKRYVGGGVRIEASGYLGDVSQEWWGNSRAYIDLIGRGNGDEDIAPSESKIELHAKDIYLNSVRASYVMDPYDGGWLQLGKPTSLYSTGSVSVANSSWVSVANITIPSTGTWMVVVTGDFAANATGRRVVACQRGNPPSGTPAYDSQNSLIMAPVNGAPTKFNSSAIIDFDADDVYYAGVWQNSGSALTTRIMIKAVRLI